jgi:hypothetical protein
VLLACGDNGVGSRFPYVPGETVLISRSGDEVERTPSGDACIELDDGDCIRPQEDCDADDHADVLLDADGKHIVTICLPDERDIGLIYADDGTAVIPDNGAVVILDDAELDGDVVVEGNRGIIYGDSPELTTLDGNLDLRGNETVVRGVTVTGDVEFHGNKAELYYCVVYGDVVLKGNENFISNCTIFGSIIGSGNEDTVINTFVQGEITFSGAPDQCRDNLRFEDSDRDLLIDDKELADAERVACE